MKYFAIILFATLATVQLQAQNTTQLREQSRTALQQGDFDKAIATLNQARQAEPNNIEVLKDLTYTYFLKRDFGAAIETGKPMVELPEADQQSFQILGLCYKATASAKEAAKLYKTALQKFPNSGVIYNEYGELLAMDKNLDDAIGEWEKGIRQDPNYSGNYYNAAMYYSRTMNWTRLVLYGENFLNLESFTKRSDDIKSVLFDAYKKALAPGALANLQQAKGLSDFEKEVLASFVQAASAVKDGGTVESITAMRKQFIQDWVRIKRTQYPYRLFEHGQQLIGDGLFDAYNYWLFHTPANEAAYQSWQGTHAKEADGFKKLQESKVFKIPAGQYYFKS
ncbi:tetratricopeptide repeat protein [Sediminibacterium soli]|uniref:tetratricopeptide repeat protein n=1 Tax=Sediminibacterium soli TaxID=2698829 RepID=UPI00137A05D9|nr:tetratricopeptide repeat protein [Sediminibacterium soli]NCI45174.1 tetratricopeptide repeat protein [Sediminibacterium soli]